MTSTPVANAVARPTSPSKLGDEVTKYLSSETFSKKIEDLVKLSIVTAVTEAIAPLANRIDAISTGIDNNTRAIADLTTKVNSVDTTVVARKLDEFEQKVTNINPAANENLMKTIDNLEQQLRSNNLIISGLPETQGENVEKLFVQLARDLGVPIIERDIISAFRAGKGTPTRPRIIIVKLLSQKAKRDIYRARLKLRKKKDKDTPTVNDAMAGATGNQAGATQMIQDAVPDQNAQIAAPEATPDGPIIYINEDLTIPRSILYKSLRAIANPRKWQTWTENGQIWLRNTLLGPAIRISTQTDIDNINIRR